MYLLHCTWLRCIKSCREDPNYEFLAIRWPVHSRFMGLGNLLEVVVHYLLIWGIISLSYQDRFLMVCALVCMITHWTGSTVSHDLRLSSIHDFTKLLYCVVSQPWENIEFVLKFVVVLTYRWNHKLIIYSQWIELLLMKADSNRYSQ